MADIFTWQRRVGFGDCDPARIAYTGRIADFALEAIDAFWEHLLDGESWFRMNVDLGYGMPFVRMEYDMRAPVTPRAALLCKVRPLQLGNSSVALGVEGWQNEVLCFEARFVSVFVTLDTMTKIPVPAHIRSAIGAI